jgi:stress response protein YsnF
LYKLLESRDRREDPENQNRIDNSDNSQLTSTNSNAKTSTTIAQVIPVIEENFSISKKMNTDSVTIQKICTTKTEKIEIPRRFEEVFVNGKKIEAFEKHDSIGDEILSKVKEGIKESLDSIHKAHYKKAYSVSEQNESKREIIPLFDYESSNNEEIEKVIPIYAEEIVVSKRMVKLGEVIIKKNRVTVNNKIDVDIQKEKVTVQYPDGVVQQLTESK